MTLSHLLVILFLSGTNAIWPPGYEVNLTQEGTFVVSEDIGSDVEDVYTDDDEMIKQKDLRHFNLEKDKGKYYRLHRMAMQSNRYTEDESEMEISKNVKVVESNFDLEEPIPWQAGFVDKKGNFIEPDNRNVRYLNAMAQYTMSQKVEAKREEEAVLDVKNLTDIKEPDYDYSSFKEEYKKQIKVALHSNETLNHTEVKEEEMVKEAVHKLIDFKETPRNCTEEEKRGIGR